MLSSPISAKVILALALAILMVWAGHSSALLMGASQPVLSGNDAAHSPAHGDGAFACAACADHYHSSLTADHVHETPHLTRLLGIGTLPERAQPIEAPRHSLPPRPIFLIERPPRATFVL
ncbi:hypothetical protein I0D00_05135 [Pseudomonas lalucatii]|uniref:DUF2946 domain-containing protein n=2 Tax=Pseudomonas lalucatii TaxID=1424203 RepID=A0ABS5PXX9_9PSED|nr:hypothetical protein [Pseudomonas lalucatii]MBS7691732.1 hypothetical protein [Pseudomonas lalucatii]MBS7724155.1 hypothetical protein [Pseudomonas lalucatii]QVM87844.1 hypothetical protein I0D68_02135 [Pseudomonas lalucatii]